MRLFAYGGTQYASRRRIGSWSAIPPGALQDQYGLVQDQLQVGCGIIDGDAVLIARQLQNPQQRGGYPFTLLLEPGETIWTRFGWNAARLALALFHEGDSPGRVLLETPDTLTEEAVDALLQGLRPVAAQPARTPPHEAAGWFVEAAFGSVVTVVPPSALGLADPTDLTSTASLLDVLPPAFRSGAGWMLGTGEAPGAALGVRLVIDPAALPASSSGRGSRLLGAFDRLRGNTLVADLLASPLHRWSVPIDGVATEAELLDRVTSGNLDDDFYQRVREQADHMTFLRREVVKTAIDRALNDRGALGPARSRFLLECCALREMKLGPDHAARLDPDTLYEIWSPDEAFPPAIAATVTFAPEPLLALWRRRMTDSADPAMTLAKALSALHPLTDDETRDQLAVTVLRSQPFMSRLAGWADVALTHPDLRLFRGQLQIQAQAQVIGRSPGWALTYVLLGEDLGGADLAGMIPSRGEGRALVAELLGEQRFAHRERIDEWLQAAARTPLRPLIPTPEKLAVSERVDGPWRWWRALYVMYEHGRDVGVDPPDRSERARLLGELDELMAAGAPEYGGPPHLYGLVVLLGGLPQKLISSMRRMEPRLTPGNSDKWTRGWELLNQRGVAESEAERSALAGRRERIEEFWRWARSRGGGGTSMLTSPELVTAILNEVAQEGCPGEADLEHLLRSLGNSGENGDTVRLAWRTLPDDVKRRAASQLLLRNHLLEPFTAALSLSDLEEIVEGFARHHGEQFLALAITRLRKRRGIKLWHRAWAIDAPIARYFLQYPDGKHAREVRRDMRLSPGELLDLVRRIARGSRGSPS